MPFTVRDVLSKVSAILQDGNSVRWPLPELLGWLNDGLREIAITKPSATAKTFVMDLQEGTKQNLPAGYHQLLQAISNKIESPASSRAITPVVKEVLDVQFPGWHSNDVMQFDDEVIHVVEDNFDARTFYVVPGNTGNGKILIVASEIPAKIEVPTSPLAIESYTAEVPIADIYQNCLQDFILSKAFSKDMNLPGAAQRAQAHFELFRAALGVRHEAEQAMNVNTPGSRFSN